MKAIFLNSRLFIVLFAIIFLFALSFLWLPLFILAQVLLIILGALLLYEYIVLKKNASQINIERRVDMTLSLGHLHKVSYEIENKLAKSVLLSIYDEFPWQLQMREAQIVTKLEPNSIEELYKEIRPNYRGVYEFRHLNISLTNNFPGLLSRKRSFPQEFTCNVYPNIIDMKQYALKLFSKTATLQGIRNIRKLGQNDEFEQIRQYQEGDNVKMINWKATSRKDELLVNQYQDTRSQQVYTIIDTGRSMEMPFNGLSLLDYSINSALAISNIVLRKDDKIGLISFGKEVETFLKADSRRSQLPLILESLYRQESNFMESSFEFMYYSLRKKVNTRSIVFLFTNFMSRADIDRNLKFLRGIAKRHLLVVIAFENTELVKAGKVECKNINDIYDQTIAKEILFEKREIMNTLKRQGIQTILTSPEQLSVNVINKYLEIKARRMS